MTTAPSPVRGWITTTQAAARTGRTRRHISFLCKRGKLRCERVGRDWLVEQDSLDAYIATDPRPGRKPKRDTPTRDEQ